MRSEKRWKLKRGGKEDEEGWKRLGGLVAGLGFPEGGSGLQNYG